ncbi:hypothetical protein MiSe_16590 [Microseira wollei NIES-4236]|uniref:FZ domain-containing protein n=1 Tax=Microseira wollei NIES-4236 TaxID=2530354 RepID=A0AAV3X9D9_9CYAN|nr:hypothetical protein MiSe_16590 [Microseira wollei NIES-4236]
MVFPQSQVSLPPAEARGHSPGTPEHGFSVALNKYTTHQIEDVLMYRSDLQAGLHSGFPPSYTNTWTPDVSSTTEIPRTAPLPRLAYQSQILAYCETFSAWQPQCLSLFRHTISVPDRYTKCLKSNCILEFPRLSTTCFSGIAKSTNERYQTLCGSLFVPCLMAVKTAVSCFIPRINHGCSPTPGGF